MLAGPVVRRVEARSCSFWVALSQQATVTALIWKGTHNAKPDDAALAQAQLATRRICARLHVAVVTIDLSSGTGSLDPGERYSYDLRFDFGGGTTSDLVGERLLADETADNRLPGVDASAPLHRALGFEENRLPSFLAPPTAYLPTQPATTSAGLRIAHSSCRRPDAAAFDAFAGLAPLVNDDAERPHLLVLTGDQIYADAVAGSFLRLVIDLGADLLEGGAQKLPGFPPDPRAGGSGSPSTSTGAGLPGNLANLPPLRRRWLLWVLSEFTGGDTENHLVTFPEFVAHHLLAWSSRVWRAVPGFDSVFRAPPPTNGPPASEAVKPDAAIDPWLNRPWYCLDDAGDEEDEAVLKGRWADPATNAAEFGQFNQAAHHVARYAAAAPRVAQVLANTPTYMIFDDHEVADDWNLNGRWVAKVYNSEWGRFVIRNGLMAYALMQGWGNDPSRFTSPNPGGKLLDQMPTVADPTSTPTRSSTAAIDVLLGFDPPAADAKRVEWSYSLDATGYRLIVLDTRTHRDVNDLSLQTPNLLVNLDEQLPARTTQSDDQLLLVVSAVPVVGPAVIEQFGQPVAQLLIDGINAWRIGDVPGFGPGDADDPNAKAGCGNRAPRGAEKFDKEGWSANDQGFEALLARLATYPSVVLLSGDVHYACTLTLDYWAETDSPDSIRSSRIVQCTSSPAKNIFKRAVEEIIRHVGNLQRAEEVPVERLAWKEIDADDLLPDGVRLSLARRSRLRRKPALVPTSGWPKGVAIPEGKEPDWRWRIEPMVDTATKAADLPEEIRPVGIPPGTDGRPVDERLIVVSGVHQRRLREGKPHLRRMVFEPNFGIVRFRQEGEVAQLVHRLYSPTSVMRFDAAKESKPPAAGPPAPPAGIGFGPHTEHRAGLRTPTDAKLPDILSRG